METLKTVLLEQPLAIYIGLAVLELALLVVWFGRRDRGTLKQMAVVAAVGVGVFLVATLIVTDRERIQRACRDIAAAAAAGDVDGVAVHLHPQFEADLRGRRVGRDVALNAARGTLRSNQVARVQFTQVSIEIGSDRAAVFVTLVADTVDQQRYILSMDTVWIRDGKRWLIREANDIRLGWQ